MRALVLLIVLVMAIGLSACGKKGNLDVPPGAPAASDQDTVQE